jgi:hypothetical protein
MNGKFNCVKSQCPTAPLFTAHLSSYTPNILNAQQPRIERPPVSLRMISDGPDQTLKAKNK